MGSEGTRILMFHRVLPDAPVSFGLPDCYRIRGTALTASELARVVDEAGPIVPLEVVEAALREGTDPPPGAVLTFDDGYREHLNVVAPMLAERTMTATFYVATGLNGTGRAVAAVDAWYWLLDHAKGDRACIPLADGRAHSGRFDTLDGKSAWVTGELKAAFLAADPARVALRFGRPALHGSRGVVGACPARDAPRRAQHSASNAHKSERRRARRRGRWVRRGHQRHLFPRGLRLSRRRVRRAGR